MSYRPNLPASTTQLGLVKPDGTTLTAAIDGTASVPGVSLTGLTAAAPLALTDLVPVNQAGADYKATGSQLATLVRKTPAGSRTAALPAALTASDMDKLVILTGTTGALSVDGTVADGFSCMVVNTASGIATYTGITDPSGGAASLAAGRSVRVSMGGSAVYALAPFSSAAATAATAYSMTQSATTGAVNVADTVTLNPNGGNYWPPGNITLSATGVPNSFGAITGGTLAGSTITPAFGTGAVTLQVTPTASGTMTLAASNTMGLTNPGNLSYTVTGGTVGPALTLTAPTFAAAKFGQGLNGGTGTATLTTATLDRGFGFWFRMNATTTYATVLQVQGIGSFGVGYNAAEISADGGTQALSSTSPPKTDATVGVNDGLWHWIYIECRSAFAQLDLWVDGTKIITFGTTGQTTGLTVNIGPANIPGCIIDDLTFWDGTDATRGAIPASAQARVSSTKAIWPLDGNGNSL